MPIKKYKPITPSQRGLSLIDRNDLSNHKPVKSLTKGLNKKGGRNNQGKITSFKKSGGHKSKYRKVDFKRRGLNGYVKTIEYDPNRSAFIARIKSDEGSLSYILAPNDIEVGKRIESGRNATVAIGNALPLSDIPVGTLIHNIELKPGRGGQLMRAAGGCGQLIQNSENKNLTRVKLYRASIDLYRVTAGQQSVYYLTWIIQIKSWEKLTKDGSVLNQLLEVLP